jgi:hypothetical protein
VEGMLDTREFDCVFLEVNRLTPGLHSYAANLRIFSSRAGAVILSGLGAWRFLPPKGPCLRR